MNRRRRSHGSSARDYPRTARVNELLREIIGDELERIDDPLSSGSRSPGCR
ncbi:MAG: hypothetical protein R2755_13700 [Acidimicrobiales bacterium]